MRNRVFAFSLIFTLLTGCSTQQVTQEQIELKWELLSNDFSEQPQARARFTLINNSRITFDDKNWALYFSQMPRSPLGADNNVTVEFISGDWFVMKPLDGFQLNPGDSVSITTEHSEWIIKETDAPLGPYLVLYDKQGYETEIIPILDYTIAPFVRPEQINRHRNDYEPIPTAAVNYDQFQKLSLLEPDELLPVIPSPASYKSTGRKVTFEEPVSIIYQQELEQEAAYLAETLEQLFDYRPSMELNGTPSPNSIFMEIDSLNAQGASHESYRLQIKGDKSVTLTAGHPAGIFYGIQSLISLVPVEAWNKKDATVALDEVIIDDTPRFGYRGLHIDVGRNFQTKETLKKIIDILSFYKGNYLVVYLSEDEGWRIEIEGLPELTEVGATRIHTTKEANALHPSYGSGPFPSAEGTYGTGFYSKADFIELLQYAQSRHVKIIPGVNFPGHSRAAIKAMESRYEKYIGQGDEEKANEFRLIDPDDSSEYLSAQWYTDNVVNVARESVYRFYGKVVDEIIRMYDEAGVEIEYFQTGGDEVAHGAWAQSPMCARLLQDLPDIKDPQNLQAYFFRRIVEMLHERGLKIGGWEEVALLRESDGSYSPNPEFAGNQVYPYVWNNQGANADLAYRLANAGYPVILCNVSNFYFDLAYNKDPREPGHYWPGFVHTRDAWQVAPYNLFYTTTHDDMGREIDVDIEYRNAERLNSQAVKNIAGMQAQIWSETVKGQEMIEYYLLPKLAGFAESAWAPARHWETIANRKMREAEMDKGWNRFANTLAQKELPRLAYFSGGYNYRVPSPGAVISNGMLQANSAYPGLSIRYTTDGSEPTTSSALYTGPTEVKGPVKLRAFDGAGKASLTVTTD